MLHDITNALALIASWLNLLAIGGGMACGVVIGAIPGLTGTMAVALALPFTFYLPPVTSILLLVGIYKGAIYGGSISAILIKTPGTPAAACTVLDGHPLAEQGNAGKALKMALYSSCTADFISNLSLIFFAQAIAALALRFGPPEFFTLVAFSLTIIAGVSGDSLLRGLISGCLGLLLATIGLDLVYGTNRFTFGNPDLMAGLNFIPVLIGLFALPEIINAGAAKGPGAAAEPSAGASSLSLQEYMASFKTIIRGSLIGVVLGAIPGVGGAPAAFMSYSEAQRTSPNADNFGKGELEGVAAAEAGNSGCCGSTMIPLLALGVPGDVITAVILGAFMVHNLTPGPLLFEQNAPLVYAIFMGMILSSLFMLAAGLASIRFFSKITSIPKHILLPGILVLCAYGSYTVNSSLFDVLVMLTMGILGYLMLLFRFPAAPFLIAFILGPMFEDNLRRSMLLSHGSFLIFFRSPICWFFILLTVLSVGMVSLKSFRKRSCQCTVK